jgi:hypothetical protein
MLTQEQMTETKSRVVRLIRRHDALDVIVPKLLGVLWDRGQVENVVKSTGFQRGFVMVYVGDGICVGGRPLGHGIHQLAIWQENTKMLSVYVAADPQSGTLACGEIGLLIRSCKRGEWEDRIIEENVQPRTLEQLRTDGLVPKQRWVDWWNYRVPPICAHAREAQAVVPTDRT